MIETYNIYSEQLCNDQRVTLNYRTLTATLSMRWDGDAPEDWSTQELIRCESEAQLSSYWLGYKEGICLFDRRCSFVLEKGEAS